MTDLLERPVLLLSPVPLGPPAPRTCQVCGKPSGVFTECSRCALLEIDAWKRREIAA